jgi:GNAT superfamily N-acetyltransferase
LAPRDTKICGKAAQESLPILSAPEYSPEIREIAVSDAAAAAQLAVELGYPVPPDEMAKRIEDLQHSTHHVVYVACLSGTVLGWIDLSIGQHLQSEPYCEIGGLVVSNSVRGGGIGRQLVAKAEQWAKEQGVQNMLVRSRVTREGAHRFYVREGYTQTKISAVFTKQLR